MHLHARSSSAKECHPARVISMAPISMAPSLQRDDSHGGVNAWEPDLGNFIWCLSNPTLWLPLSCVLAPDALAAISIYDGNDDIRVFTEGNLAYLGLAISGLYGPHEREHDVLPRTRINIINIGTFVVLECAERLRSAKL